MGFPETSVRDYHYSVHNNVAERRCHVYNMFYLRMFLTWRRVSGRQFRRTTANCKGDSNVGPPRLCIANKQTRNWVLLEELSSLTSQGTAHTLWNPKFHYRTQNRAQHVRVLVFQSSPRSPILVLRSILILSSRQRLGLPSGFFPSGFLTKPFAHFAFPRTCHMPRPSHLPWFH